MGQFGSIFGLQCAAVAHTDQSSHHGGPHQNTWERTFVSVEMSCLSARACFCSSTVQGKKRSLPHERQKLLADTLTVPRLWFGWKDGYWRFNVLQLRRAASRRGAHPTSPPVRLPPRATWRYQARAYGASLGPRAVFYSAMET